MVTINAEIGPHTKGGTDHALDDAVAFLATDSVTVAVGAHVLPIQSQMQARKESGVKRLNCCLIFHGLYTYPP